MVTDVQHKDSNADFIKIDRILPVVDCVRGTGISYKRLTFRGHDGSLHPFAVQYPAARHCRREERIQQLLRMFNEYALPPPQAASMQLSEFQFWKLTFVGFWRGR